MTKASLPKALKSALKSTTFVNTEPHVEGRDQDNREEACTFAIDCSFVATKFSEGKYHGSIMGMLVSLEVHTAEVKGYNGKPGRTTDVMDIQLKSYNGDTIGVTVWGKDIERVLAEVSDSEGNTSFGSVLTCDIVTYSRTDNKYITTTIPFKATANANTIFRILPPGHAATLKYIGISPLPFMTPIGQVPLERTINTSAIAVKAKQEKVVALDGIPKTHTMLVLEDFGERKEVHHWINTNEEVEDTVGPKMMELGELAEEQRMVNKAVGVIAHNVFFMQDKRVEGGVKGLTSRSTEIDAVAVFSKVEGLQDKSDYAQGMDMEKFGFDFHAQGKRCFLAPNTPSEGTIFLFNGQVSNITYRHGQYLSQNCLDFENHMVVNNGSDEEGCKWNCSKCGLISDVNIRYTLDITMSDHISIFSPTDACIERINGPARKYLNSNGTINTLDAINDVKGALMGLSVQAIVRRMPGEHYVVTHMRIMSTPHTGATSPVPSGSRSAPTTPMKRKMTMLV